MSASAPATDNTGSASAISDEIRDESVLSQWQLIRLKFSKHKVAMFSLYFLGLLYFIAVFAEFFAPYGRVTRQEDMLSAPPMLPGFNFKHGLNVDRIEAYRNPITLKSSYLKSGGEPIKLGFFVKGEPYKLWGLIPMQRHFFGVKSSHYANQTEKPFVAFFGTDRFGHDIFSRIVYGSRVSLSIGLVSIFITFLLGAIIGGISGYAGGRIDNFIQRLIEIINSFPSLPLWMALGAIFPLTWSPLTAYFAITIVISFLGWTGLARVVRGKILSLREEDYAIAARLIGASHSRIIFKHLMPGFTSHIIVTLTLSVPGMILGETALSFLGLGLRPPIVSWGVMLQDAINPQVVVNYPWLLTPVLFIALTVLSFNFLGDGLRDAADPYATASS